MLSYQMVEYSPVILILSLKIVLSILDSALLLEFFVNLDFGFFSLLEKKINLYTSIKISTILFQLPVLSVHIRGQWSVIPWFSLPEDFVQNFVSTFIF